MKPHYQKNYILRIAQAMFSHVMYSFFLSLLFWLIACTQPKPSAPKTVLPPPLPEPAISALVNSIPDTVEISFKGEKVGYTPVKLKIHSVDQLISSLATVSNLEKAVEKRISIISESEVEVTLVFDSNQSVMTKVLNLPKILIFDYGEGITFDFNKSELKPDLKPILLKQAEMLKNYFSGIDIHICGHSDSIGRRERNLELSLARAESVFNELAELGIPKASMKKQGFGSDYPLVSNDTEAGRARNRRIEIILGN